jgi:hypothetical protein
MIDFDEFFAREYPSVVYIRALEHPFESETP